MMKLQDVMDKLARLELENSEFKRIVDELQTENRRLFRLMRTTFDFNKERKSENKRASMPCCSVSAFCVLLLLHSLFFGSHLSCKKTANHRFKVL